MIRLRHNYALIYHLIKTIECCYFDSPKLQSSTSKPSNIVSAFNKTTNQNTPSDTSPSTSTSSSSSSSSSGEKDENRKMEKDEGNEFMHYFKRELQTLDITISKMNIFRAFSDFLEIIKLSSSSSQPEITTAISDVSEGSRIALLTMCDYISVNISHILFDRPFDQQLLQFTKRIYSLFGEEKIVETMRNFIPGTSLPLPSREVCPICYSDVLPFSDESFATCSHSHPLGLLFSYS